MTFSERLRPSNLRPIGDHDSASQGTVGASIDTTGVENIDKNFQNELSKLDRYFEDNQAGYENRRRQLKQRETDLRIISNVGRELLFNKEIGLEDRGSGAPVFRYYPPHVGTENIKKFSDGIKFVVMHSFGRARDIGMLSKTTARTVPIDPFTGHNPGRFANGVSTFISKTAKDAGIHHLVSLRGDLVNSASWDSRVIHANTLNDYAIGIEHEEWVARAKPVTGIKGRTIIRDIQDIGPFSEAQYALDAFILKKLESFTGKSFANYLGVGSELDANIAAQTPGVVAHAAVPKGRDSDPRKAHVDPGAEFFLPIGYQAGITPSSAIPIPGAIRMSSSEWIRAWDERAELWYSDIPAGTLLSAYDRIFEKLARLRSFDLQTEVFDGALRDSRIAIVVPEVRSTYTVALAESATQTKLSGLSRAEVMQGQSRVQVFTAGQRTNNAISEAWSRGSANLIQLQQTQLKLPVVINAIGKDPVTGEWVRTTNTTTLVTNSDGLTSTPVTEDSKV